MEKATLVNIGCGIYPRQGYCNIDKNITAKCDLQHDVRDGLPFDTSTINEVLAEHFVEHLYREELLALIEEIYRVLKPGAVMRLIYPIGDTGDLDHVRVYQAHSFDELAKDDTAAYYQRNWKWHLGRKRDRVDKSLPHRPIRTMEISLVAVK